MANGPAMLVLTCEAEQRILDACLWGANPLAFLPEFENDKQALVYYELIRGKLFDRRPA